MGNGLSTDQGSFTPHGLRDVDKFGTEQRQHDWSNPEDDNMLAGAPNNEEINSLSTFNRKDGPAPTSHNIHKWEVSCYTRVHKQTIQQKQKTEQKLPESLNIKHLIK